MEFGNALPYDIVISGSNNKGFIVKTGCCTSVFTDKKVMLAAIEDYINDPEKMKKAYNESNQGPISGPVALDSGPAGICFTEAERGNTLRVSQEDCSPEGRSRR